MDQALAEQSAGTLIAELHEGTYIIRSAAGAALGAGQGEGTAQAAEEHVGHGSWLNPVAEKIGLPPFVLWTWVAAALLLALSIAGTRRLKRIPERGLGGLLELVVDALIKFTQTALPRDAQRHAPFIGTLFIFILVCNLMGIVPGAISPTGTERLGLNTTVALAMMAFLYTQYWGFRTHGLGYVKHFIGEPWWLFMINIPVHIIGELARPVSLAVRLYGNVGGEDKILLVLAGLWIIGTNPQTSAGGLSVTGDSGWFPGGVFLHFPLTCFAVFTAFLQALVFAALTCAYVAGATEAHREMAEEREEGTAAEAQAAA